MYSERYDNIVNHYSDANFAVLSFIVCVDEYEIGFDFIAVDNSSIKVPPMNSWRLLTINKLCSNYNLLTIQ